MDTENVSPVVGKKTEHTRVLLCGGPLHGEWVEVPVHSPAYYFRRYKEQSTAAMMVAGGPPMLPDLEEHVYQVKPACLIDRRTIWIGVHMGVRPMDEEKTIAKAVFQRDVYARLYGPER